MTERTHLSTSLDPETLIADLVNRGVRPDTAHALIKHYSTRGIRRQIAFYDHELRHGTRPDPAWLVDFRIKQEWRAPDDYPDETKGKASHRRGA